MEEENQNQSDNNTGENKGYVSVDKRVVWIFLVFIAVVVVGYAIGLSSPQDKARSGVDIEEHDHDHGHDHMDHKHGHEGHDHSELLNVSADALPTVDIRVFEDSENSWNVEIITDNFAFTPESVSQAHVEGEGHAHMYLNDVKLGRVYGAWYHLGSLKPGENEVRVTLNANSHEQLAVDGVPVEASTTINVE